MDAATSHENMRCIAEVFRDVYLGASVKSRTSWLDTSNFEPEVVQKALSLIVFFPLRRCATAKDFAGNC